MRKLKLTISIGLMSVVVILLSGCQTEASERAPIRGVPVEVMQTEETSRSVNASYMGTVVPEDQIKYAFKTGGRLEEIYVKPGDHIYEGQIIAKLDASDLDLQLSSVESQMLAAEKDIRKTRDAFDYTKGLYEKMIKLYENGAISKDKLEQAQLNYEMSESSLNQAVNAYDSMKANFALSDNMRDGSVILASNDGIVLSTQFESGELVSQGYPVVVARSKSKVVQVGLSLKDMDLIGMNTKASVINGSESILGEIIEISDMPDMATRTFLTKVKIEHEDIRLGEIVDVKFDLGKNKGIWLPMTVLLSDGEKFVYIIDNGRAFKRTVEIGAIAGFEVEVKGVYPGEAVVVSGMKQLIDGAIVEVVLD